MRAAEDMDMWYRHRMRVVTRLQELIAWRREFPNPGAGHVVSLNHSLTPAPQVPRVRT